MDAIGWYVHCKQSRQLSRGLLRRSLFSSSINTACLPSHLTPDPWPEGLCARGWLPSSHAHSIVSSEDAQSMISSHCDPQHHTRSHTGGSRTSGREGPSFSAVFVLITVQLGSALGTIHRLETEAQLKRHCRLLIRVLQRAAPTTSQRPPGREPWDSTCRAPQRAGGT